MTPNPKPQTPNPKPQTPAKTYQLTTCNFKMDTSRESHKKTQSTPLKQKETSEAPSDSLQSGRPFLSTANDVIPDKTWDLIKLLFVVLAILLGAVLLLFYFSFMNKEPKNMDDIIIRQPLIENNEFRTVKMPNGMSVVLNNPNNGYDTVFMSLTIGVGTQDDPEDFPGLTKLIKEAFLCGSEYYPNDSTIEKLMEKYQGKYSSMVKETETIFTFRIHDDGLSELFHILADAFMQPLFHPDTLKTEMGHLYSAISGSMTQDKSHGLYKLLKVIGNPKSRIFFDGNKLNSTKNVNYVKMQERLKDFHSKFYVPQLISLVVMSGGNQDRLDGLIKDIFSQLQETNTARPMGMIEDQKYIPPLLPEVKGRVYYMQSFNNVPKLHLVAETHSDIDERKFSAYKYFKFLLLNEEADSFVSRLQKSKLANDVNMGIEYRDQKKALVKVTFDLSERGVNKISEVIIAFIQYLRLLKKMDIKETLYKQMQYFSNYTFLFKSYSLKTPFEKLEEIMYDRITKMGRNVLNYGYEYTMTAGKIWNDFNREEMNNFLDQFDAENLIYVIETKKFHLQDELKKANLDQLKGINKVAYANLTEEHSWFKTDENKKESEKLHDHQIRKVKEKESHKQLAASIFKKGLFKKAEEDRKEDYKNKKEGPGNPNPGEVTNAKTEEEVEPKIPERILKAKRKSIFKYPGKANYIESDSEKFRKQMLKIISMSEKIHREEIRRLDRKGLALLQKSGSMSDRKLTIDQFIEFFNDIQQKITLKYKLPFDGGRGVHVVKIKDEDWEQIKEYAHLLETVFKKFSLLKINDFMQYDVNTECKMADSLVLKRLNLEKVNVLTDPNAGSIQEKKGAEETSKVEKQMMDIQNIIDTLEDPSNLKQVRRKKFEIMNGFINMKICMLEEFQADDEITRPDKLIETDQLMIFYKIYRKTLQPQIHFRILISNKTLQESMIRLSLHDNHELYYKMKLIAKLLNILLTRKMYDYLILGGEIIVDYDGANLVIQAFSPSSGLREFMNKFLSEIMRLRKEQFITPSNLILVKNQLLSEILLNTDEKTDKITKSRLRSAIDGADFDLLDKNSANRISRAFVIISPRDIAMLYDSFIRGSKLTAMFLGNTSKKEVMQMTEMIHEHFYGEQSKLKIPDQSMEQKSSWDPSAIVNVWDYWIIDFTEQREHFMIRGLAPNESAVNNNYLTYFHCGKLDKKGHLMLLMLTNLLKYYFDRKLVLENPIGSSSETWLETNYLESGIAMKLMGSKFNPMHVEADVDRVLKTFVFKFLHEKTSSEINNLLKDVLFQNIIFDDDLEDVTKKTWENLHYELFLSETKTFFEIANEIDRTSFLDFVRNLLVDSQKRITIELLIHKFKEEDLKFQAEQSLNLGNLQYQVVDVAFLNEIRKKQFENE
jgi:secreted Zn-dependent insulinase-like peptidase